MRALLVDTAREWRGGQNQILLTASGLRARGEQVTLVCRRGGQLESRAREAGLPLSSLPFRGDLSLRALLPLARLIRESGADLLQLNDAHAVACGVLASRLAGRATTLATRRVDFPLRGPLSRRKYAACDGVIAVSRAIRQVLEADGLAPERLHLVYEGVADRPPAPGGREALRQLGIPEDSPVVGTVAALTDHKDHATLLAAIPAVAARLPKARFLLIGDGELRAPLEAQARELALGERCVFAGFRTDLDRLIPALTVFCLTSKWEGLGTSLLDAMCFARPIVATSAGGIPEAVADGISGRLVPVGDSKALAEALVALLSDAATGEAMGREGRRRFETCFTAERMAEETLRVYEALR
jgi:glycosyltransferase involved in cell wall biosynthesis